MAGTYKEILARFKKDLGNTYQAQKNIVDVSQKYIGLLENAEGGGSGGGGIDYSETEQDTGLKWIDGKTIYQKTISYTASTSTGEQEIEAVTGMATLLEVIGVGVAGTQVIPIPYYGGTNDYYLLWAKGNKMYQSRGSGNGFSGTPMYITIRYTKS